MAARTPQDKLHKAERKKPAIQSEFSIGEQVLCYEPDSSKAKMLYEARILEIDITKDEKGKKVPEYFIHFVGWNKSWDRWVLNESVLKESDENKQLQKKLYEKAVGNKKRPKYQRQKHDTENDGVETASQSNQSTANSSNAEAEHSSELPFVSIDIPNILKSKLEDDCYFIKRKKKLLKLPRSPNALQILQDYLQYCEINESSDNYGSNPSGKAINIDIVREVVEGLQTYLNFTLSTLLLYNFEKEQYDALFSSRMFSEGEKGEFAEQTVKVDSAPLQQQLKASESNKSPSKRKSTRRKQLQEYEYEMSGYNAEGATAEVLMPPVSHFREDEAMQSPPRKRGRPSRKQKVGLASTSSQKTLSRRETRANAQLEVVHDEKQPHVEGKHVEEKSKQFCNPIESSESQVNLREPEKQLMETSQTTDCRNEASKLDIKLEGGKEDKNNFITEEEQDYDSILRTLRPRRPLFVATSVKLNYSESAADQCTLPVGASARSMEKSKNQGNFTSEEERYRQESDAKGSSYMQFPFTGTDAKSPAEIYGAEHLLRLFVKLPTMIARSELDPRKRSLLIEYLEMFLRYLAEHANGLFDRDHYSESVI